MRRYSVTGCFDHIERRTDSDGKTITRSGKKEEEEGGEEGEVEGGEEGGTVASSLRRFVLV